MTAPSISPLKLPLTQLIAGSLAPTWAGALCAEPGQDPEDWHPFPTQDYSHARAVCSECPLRRACLEFGRRNKLPGVWGGERLG